MDLHYKCHQDFIYYIQIDLQLCTEKSIHRHYRYLHHRITQPLLQRSRPHKLWSTGPQKVDKARSIQNIHNFGHILSMFQPMWHQGHKNLRNCRFGKLWGRSIVSSPRLGNNRTDCLSSSYNHLQCHIECMLSGMSNLSIQ